MNSYIYEDITIGMSESFDVTITEEMMDMFKCITGDINPLHNDPEYAKKNNFPDRVVYGLLTSSFLSTLAGVYLPGEKSLIYETEIKLKKPVYVGNKLTVSGKVTEKNDIFKTFSMSVEIRNENNEKVLRGSMRIGFTS